MLNFEGVFFLADFDDPKKNPQPQQPPPTGTKARSPGATATVAVADEGKARGIYDHGLGNTWMMMSNPELINPKKKNIKITPP